MPGEVLDRSASLSSIALAFVSMLLAGNSGAQDAGRAAFPAETGGPGAAPDAHQTLPLVLEGRVLVPGGHPAVGARVTSSAGGLALADETGSFRLALDVPSEAASLVLLAEGGPGGRQRARGHVPLPEKARWLRVRPLELVTEQSPRWLPTFGEAPGVDDAEGRQVLDLAEYDDGTGAALFACGNFGVAGSSEADFVAKWNGQRWEGLRSGLDHMARAAMVHDDGSGPELFVGGLFTRAGGHFVGGVAKWNGTRWAPVGSGPQLRVYDMAVHDDGNSHALYVAAFAPGTSTVIPGVWKWDGTSWTELGGDWDGLPSSLVTFDDGSGPALYAGGDFDTIDGIPARALARWDGTRWVAPASEVSGSISALRVFDDGTGPALFAGGRFGTAGGVVVRNVAKWDGQIWSTMAGGVNGSVFSLATFDDGTGLALYVGGSFTNAGGREAQRIARWDGTGWTRLGDGLSEFQSGVLPTAPMTMVVSRVGGVPALFVGGTFNVAGNQSAQFVARWTGNGWSALGSGLGGGVEALAVFDDGSGPALYAAGSLLSADGTLLDHVAKREGNGWQPLGTGIGHDGGTRVEAMAVFDDGRGQALYVGGLFTSAGGVPARRVARWDGESWSALDEGVDSFASVVNDMVVFDDGGGPALYVGGEFTSVSGVGARRIARWDGQAWSTLGSGMNAVVHALAVFDDGTGPALYAGGGFSTAGDGPASGIARWDGQTWSPVGSGFQGGILSLAVHDDGSGPALYAGGNFFQAFEGVSTGCVARWDGIRWTALGSGTNNTVWAFASHDDGTGSALYVGGFFTVAGGIAMSRIARWDGAGWSPLESGVSARGPQGVLALLSHDDGRGPALYAGGGFWNASRSGDSFLARWAVAARSTVVLDFETEDDFETELVNGQHVDAEFGALVGLSSSGPNAGLGIFDSTVGGPNDPSQDLDLLVGSGNLLILQTENFPPDANDVFPRPNDDEDGGTITLNFARPLEARSVALVDIDAGDGTSYLRLRDSAGLSRVFTVPANWTGDRLVAGPGKGTIDCTTLEPQQGFGSLVTAVEDDGFDPLSVVLLSLTLAGSGAIDEVTIAGENLALPEAATWIDNGSGVNPRSLSALSLPVLGSTWRSSLDCTSQGPGLAILEVRRSSARATTPFGQVLIGGELVFGTTRPQPGAPCALAWSLPLDMALVGVEVHAQGLCLGSGGHGAHSSARRARLSNAIGLRLGF